MRRYFYALVPLLVLLGATFLACIASYFIVQHFGDDYPFRKIIKKSTLFFLALSIFPIMAVLKLNKADLGFAPRPIFFKQLLTGFGLGFLTLIPVIILLTALGINIIDESQPWTGFWIGKKLLIELFLALLIGFFEESLFRGLFLRGLAKHLPLAAAILLSALYYASLHFLDSKTLIPTQELTVFSGFKLLGEAVVNIFNPDILPAFFAILMVGICLGLLRTQVKQSLGYCIGCHASWVWQIKLNKSFFNTDFSNPYAYLVSAYDGVVGPLVAGWLLLVVVLYSVYRRLGGGNCG
ncbi:MAG: CPBP family intramembrane metalloprotease [Methylococcaceae bacterium]|nr:CPBP family intramembrane metalloprotease [Methylococcaceae bacterium]